MASPNPHEAKFLTLVINDDGTLWPLHLERKTRAECERSIAFQVRGGRQRDEYEVAECLGRAMARLDDGNVVDLANTVYTKAAWHEFTQREG